MVRKLTIAGLIARLADRGACSSSRAAAERPRRRRGSDRDDGRAVDRHDGASTDHGGSSTTTAASTATTTAPARPPATPIKIGVIASLTGTAAPAFPAIQQGLMSWKSTPSTPNGGINGRPITADHRRRQVRPGHRRLGGHEAHHPGQGRRLAGAAVDARPPSRWQPLAEKYQVPEIRWDTPTLESPATKRQVGDSSPVWVRRM